MLHAVVVSLLKYDGFEVGGSALHVSCAVAQLRVYANYHPAFPRGGSLCVSRGYIFAGWSGYVPASQSLCFETGCVDRAGE